MVTTLPNSLVRTPNWAPHRMGLTHAAASATIPVDDTIAHGVASDGFHYAMYRVRTGAGISEIKTRALFWDDILEKYVADPAVTEQTFSSDSLNGQYTFSVFGRRFFVAITSVTGTGAIDIEVSGFGD